MLVAATSRTLTLRVFWSPRRSISPSCSTRSSLALRRERAGRRSRRETGCRRRPARTGRGARPARRYRRPFQRRTTPIRPDLRDGGAIDRNERGVAARTHIVQGAGKEFLADAGFAQQQHGDAVICRLFEQFVGSAKAGRVSHHIGRQSSLSRRWLERSCTTCGLQVEQLVGDRFPVEEMLMLFGVVPFLDRLADNAAVVLTHADAFYFLVEHRSAHECRGIAAGVADLGPAHRLAINAVIVPVPLPLPGVLPQEFAVELAGDAIQFQLDRRDPDNALQRVQLRAGHEGLDVARVLGADDARARRRAHPRHSPCA